MKTFFFTLLVIITLSYLNPASARTKLVALPDRETTRIRLDHPAATLVEEERTLTLHKGINHIDFSWQGVSIDRDSIRLTLLSEKSGSQLINVNYPPAGQALIWEIVAQEGRQEKVRISYLLANIDRVITYETITDKQEQQMDLSSFLVLRNFSGEPFINAEFEMNYGRGFTRSIADGETKRLLFFERDDLAIEKWFTFDAGKLPWEPDKQQSNVGIPVHYQLTNSPANGLGEHALWNGKARLFQNDGRGSTIFLGEDKAAFTPVAGDVTLHIGDSRDLVVTQRRTGQERHNIRRDRKNRIVLYDREDGMRIEIENFKNRDARLRIIEPMSGEWKILDSSHPYERQHAGELRFELTVPAGETITLTYRSMVRNIRA